MIKIDLATLFPAMCETVLSESIIGRARKAGYLDIRCFHIRDYTVDRHRNVDDTPYGPGKGMLMQADPMYRTWDAACEARGGHRPHAGQDADAAARAGTFADGAFVHHVRTL